MLAATAVGTRMGPSARVDATSISNGLPIQKDRRRPPQLSAEFRPLHLTTCLRWNPRPHMDKNLRRGIWSQLITLSIHVFSDCHRCPLSRGRTHVDVSP
jgi:hypothetical protein